MEALEAELRVEFQSIIITGDDGITQPNLKKRGDPISPQHTII